ncbi:MAG: DJ-1/PfpI family protein [Clostridia bacterium]|nr:DJ-1/PfpI family protein [Clostridia bacterium]
MIYIFLANGFEEIEALTPVDVFRRARLDTVTVSITDSHTVVGSHNIAVAADKLLSEVDLTNADLLLLPGGMPGTKHLGECKPLCDAVSAHAQAGKPVAAICAAPSVLGTLGLLRGKEAICYPGFEDALIGATVSEKKVVCDGNVVTAAGMGVALDFALECLCLLGHADDADRIRTSVIAE